MTTLTEVQAGEAGSLCAIDLSYILVLYPWHLFLYQSLRVPEKEAVESTTKRE